MHSISFNMETTLHNVNGDIDLMISIAEIVMEDLPELVRRLRVAGDQSDWLNVQQGAHAIRGMAANLVAQPLTNLASRLECLGESDQVLIHEAVDTIDRIADLTRKALRIEINRWRSTM